MNDKYKKQDNHKTDKWGNVVYKEKPESKNNQNQRPINNPFAEFFKDVKFEGEKC